METTGIEGRSRFAYARRACARSAARKAMLATCISAGLLCACCAASATETLQPFTTDGCSRFPDRAPDGRSDWCHCCVVHDLAYWRGGSSRARRNADLALKSCVSKASGSKALAETMFLGVRAAGGPSFPTPYRWGYGWPLGRPYRPLTAQELALAGTLERAYRAKNPLLACPSEASPHQPVPVGPTPPKK